MNKEQSLAAHRIKKSVALAAKRESLAKKRVKIAEAKVVKANEAFEVAKDIVAKQKATLELAKQQILEQRELIKKYEALINTKYQQIDESKKSAKKADEALRARVESFVAKYNEKVKATEELESKVSKQTEVLVKAKECILSLREAKRKLEETISRREKIAECDANATVTPEVAPLEDQKPEPVKEPGTKVEPEKVDLDKFDEVKAKKIAKIYNEKYSVAEEESMQIFGKFGMKEAVERIQTIADAKVAESKKNEAAKLEAKQRKIAKIYNEKYSIAEEESMKIFGEVADIKAAVEKIQGLANEKLEAKKAENKKVVKPVKRINRAAESINKRIRPTKSKDSKVDEAKAIKIAKIYNQKYKMDEKASMNILRAYPQQIALEKLQSIANVTKKYITEAKTTKVEEAKTPEIKTSNMYSLFI